MWKMQRRYTYRPPDRSEEAQGDFPFGGNFNGRVFKFGSMPDGFKGLDAMMQGLFSRRGVGGRTVQKVLKSIRADPRLQTALGRNVEIGNGGGISFSVDWSAAAPQFSVPVRGENGRGTLDVTFEKGAGNAVTVSSVVVRLASGERVQVRIGDFGDE
eukprot:c740_g1_i2.p3 GENE.c740_g1_i2~~c740_g1_i2.p3  ORF type:complete len:157 (-),score=20.88 c740_g1_i2:235-705(-)